MTSAGRRHLTWALLASLLLHVSLLGAPDWLGWLGWPMATQEGLLEPTPAQLDAQLIAPPVRKAAPPPVRPAPPGRRKSAPVPQILSQEAPSPVSVAAAPLPPPALAPPLAPLGAPDLPAGSPEAAAASTTSTTTPPLEPVLPRRGSIRFVVSRGDQGFVVGQSEHRWSHDGASYTLRSVTETTGLAALFRPVQVTQSSAGDIGAEGLRPREFLTGRDGRSGDAARFDWSGMTLGLSGGGRREVALVPGAQDLLSMFYQFGQLLADAAPTRPAGESLTVSVATGRKFERYAFGIVGEETLPTKFGAQRVLHLRTASGAEATEVWLALGMRGLPLKIRYTDREGESYDQVADEIEFEGKQNPAGSQ